MDFSKARPRAVEAYLRESALRIFGDAVENAASITSSHGYYDVYLTIGSRTITFHNFRKKDASKIVKAMRALK